MSSIRTFLFVPASKPERIAKALASGAGQVIVDLEDAVAPDAKVTARDALREWLRTHQANIAVRINGADTPWFDEDLAVCAQFSNVVAVVVPKAECVRVLDQCAAIVPHAVLLPLVETAVGMEALKEIGKVPRVQRLVFGSIDFQLDMGIQGDSEELLFFRSRLVLESRLAGLQAPVDGVTTDIQDAVKVRAEAERARRLGFGAKLCIHPSQVEVVEAAFRPSIQEMEWARRVIAEAQASAGAVASLDGKMIDRPVILRAHDILTRASAM